MIYVPASQLESELDEVLRTVPRERIVVVEPSPDFIGELVFQVFGDPAPFQERYRDWVSRFGVLNSVFTLGAFLETLENDDYHTILLSSCAQIVESVDQFTEPLVVDGYDLHPFQQFGLRRAMSQELFFFNWSTGAGKSFASAAGARWLFDRDSIDVVVAATVSKSKLDLCNFFHRAGIDAVVNDGTKSKRRRVYRERHRAYVCNYEKFNFDQDELHQLTQGRRVLFVLDEVQKIITDDAPNLARKGFIALVRDCSPQSRIWAMSASVVNGNPLRYRDVFNLSRQPNPLAGRTHFIDRYADSVRNTEVRTPRGRSFTITSYDWNQPRLQEVRHRVASCTQAVRKTDPGVREHFRGLATIVESVQVSDEERALYGLIIEGARAARERGESLAPHYGLLRYAANTPLALRSADSDAARAICAQVNVDEIARSKLEKLNETLSSIRESGDQAVVFTHWTNLTLHLIAPQIEVPLVCHYGAGQTPAQSQSVKEWFCRDPSVTCFLTSDAGSHGLNLQNARYVIQYEPTYSYDDGMQRASRIDRADSHLDGLTNYVYCVADSVEERVWKINQDRRQLSEVVQGTVEALSYGDAQLARRSEGENLTWLMFGEQ